MNLKNFSLIVLAFILVLVVITGCSKAIPQDKHSDNEISDIDIVSAKSIDDMFTNRDLTFDYDEKIASKIRLNGKKIKTDSKNVTVKKSTITINKEGIYIFQGNLTNGQIIVDVPSTDKVQLVLNGANINCNTSAAVYVKQAGKVFITLNNNTKNELTVKNDFKAIDENKIDSAVFSKSDLTLNGSGELSINCNSAHGIVSKKDLKITGGVFNISAKKHALQAKNSIRVKDGTLNLKCEKDGFNCNYDGEKSDKGFVFIAGGSINISAGDDGIHASDSIQIIGGKINISKCNEGIESESITIFDGEVLVASDDDGINAASSSNSEQTASNDPFSVDENCIINIYGGKININADGDGIDSNGNVNITGGETYIQGPENNGNAPLDYNGTALISSGIFVAVGSSGMAQGFGDNSAQCSMLVSLSGNANGNIVLKDSNGNELLSFAPSKKYSCAIISHPDIEKGNKYSVYYGENNKSVKMNDITYSDISSSDFKMNHSPKGGGDMPEKGNKNMPAPGGDKKIEDMSKEKQANL